MKTRILVPYLVMMIAGCSARPGPAKQFTCKANDDVLLCEDAEGHLLDLQGHAPAQEVLSQLAPGDRVMDQGVGAVVPAPGYSVSVEAENDDGAAIRLDISTGEDGVITVARRSDAAIERSARATSENVCSDSTYHLFGFKWNTPYIWRFNAATVPGTLNADAVEAHLRQAAGNITRGRNTCNLPDIINAQQQYEGRTNRRANINGDNNGMLCNDKRDNSNTIDFGGLPGRTLAVTCIWAVKATGQAVAADMRLDPEYTWFTTDTTPPNCQNQFGIEPVATHEFGHVFGLDHVSEADHPELTMSRFTSPCSTAQSTLGRGDWLGLSTLYDASPSPSPTSVPTQTFLSLDGYQDGAPGTASVSGNVFRAGSSTPAAGTVTIKFQKLVDGVWTLMSMATRVLVNGHYEVPNWGVGVGQWRVSAGFPAQGDYLGSDSNFHEFSIQRVATEAFLTLDQVLNGQPGYVSVSGHVLRTNGDPVIGVVNVNFVKFVNGDWMTMSTAQRTLSNGSYDVAYWRVGVGQWRVRVVLPEQGDYASSVSDYHSFEVKSGYRLVNRHSDKCMSLAGNNFANGTAILQWDCSGSPSPGDGQVFTLAPLGGGDFNILINSTSKCVDVIGVSQTDGTFLQQWDCLGPGQRNQVWRVIPITGQPPYVAFQAQHSGKCADVLGAGTVNGVRIGQWGCWWGGNQQWTLQAID